MKLYRMQGLSRNLNISRSTIYSLLKRGDFPAPIQLGPRAVAWRDIDIQEWLEQRGTVEKNGDKVRTSHLPTRQNGEAVQLAKAGSVKAKAGADRG